MFATVQAHPQTGSWLTRAYEFVGAHTHPRRLAHEQDRALQRMLLPVASVAWISLFHLLLGSPISVSELGWCAAALAYAAASAAYRNYLEHCPAGGVHVQYAFLIGDPLLVGWALFLAPEPLAWWLVLLLVMIVRVGFRYGLNAMKVELPAACVAAAIPLVFGSYWHVQVHMAASLAMMLLCTWWLFAPLNRSLERAKLLEIEKARVDSLQETLAAKSEFLSRISHELRSPLQGLLSAVELLEARVAQETAEAELLSRIRRSATSLHTQVRDLLTIARGDVGKIEIHPMPFDACELVTSVAREALSEARAKGLRLDVAIPPEPVYAVADAGRVDQVLTNLLNNAIRHTKRGAVGIEFRGYDPSFGGLRFVVRDTGPGLRQDRLASLFEPFTRFGDLTGSPDGSGLGLAVVKSVLNYLGGSVRVQSEPGQGAEFHVDVPAELLDADAPMNDSKSAKRILIVDDRPEILEALDAVVSQLGFRCDSTDSVARAANLLGARTYDIALIDLQMPVKSGLDLASETRRGEGPNVTSTMFSMSASDASTEALSWPFNGHLSKPISKTALLRAIEQRGLSEAATR